MDRPLELEDGNKLINDRNIKFQYLNRMLDHVGQIELNALIEIERELSLREE